MNDFRFYVLFNGISVISGHRDVNNESCVQSNSVYSEKISPRVGIEHGTARLVGQSLSV